MLIVCILLLLVYCQCQNAELLDNPDFESTSGFGKWEGRACNLLLSDDSYQGNKGAKITERKYKWAGIRQNVTVEPATRYVFKAYIKLLNHKAGYMYHEVKVIVNTPGVDNDHIATQQKLQKDFNWIEIGGDFITRAGVTNVIVFIQIEEPEVNYLFDTASFKKLQDNKKWKLEAEKYIENSRKSNITLRATGINNLSTRLTIKLEQLTSKFGFGSGIRVDDIVNPSLKDYQDFFYDNFEWATVGNGIKWKQQEPQENELQLGEAWTAIQALRKKGVPLRAHNVFWSSDGHMPSWLDSKNKDELLKSMKKRVKDVIGNTTGTIKHWVVNNELLHGHYYERRLNDADIGMKTFDWVHKAEPGAKLFLNDFHVVNKGTYTTAFANQGKRFINAGKPLHGMGIQSHFKSGHIDMTALKYRLDKVAETGLPIWISEMTINEMDVNVRATALENVMTMCFGHPAVAGITLFGFWDRNMGEPNAYLAEGDDVTPNAAGKIYLKLRKTWTTNIQSMNIAIEETVIRAFQGKYTLTVLKNGAEISKKTFTLGQNQKTIDLLS